jgi:hypothetical protein
MKVQSQSAECSLPVRRAHASTHVQQTQAALIELGGRYGEAQTETSWDDADVNVQRTRVCFRATRASAPRSHRTRRRVLGGGHFATWSGRSVGRLVDNHWLVFEMPAEVESVVSTPAKPLIVHGCQHVWLVTFQVSGAEPTRF